jgi:hypothetical protein
MLNTRGRTDGLFKRLSRLSLLRLVRNVILGLLTLQVLTAIVLLVITALGKRRKHEISFPHEPFKEVQVGENFLHLYAYGRELYDAMLEAIEAAQESIYKALNIFILSSHFLSSRCGHPYVPGHIEAQVEPGSPERAVCYMFLEHGEWWDEHLVDDVHDAVVGDHVRREHMPTIDRDAFSHSGGYRV